MSDIATFKSSEIQPLTTYATDGIANIVTLVDIDGNIIYPRTSKKAIDELGGNVTASDIPVDKIGALAATNSQEAFQEIYDKSLKAVYIGEEIPVASMLNATPLNSIYYVNDTSTDTQNNSIIQARNISLSIEGMTATNVEEGIRENFTTVVNGKKLLETAINDMGGIVSKESEVPTFEELKLAILNLKIL